MPTKIPPKGDFLTSIGHGADGGGQGQVDGVGGTGDPTIEYVVKPTWAKPMGKTGAFGTPYQQGKISPKTTPGVNVNDY